MARTELLTLGELIARLQELQKTQSDCLPTNVCEVRIAERPRGVRRAIVSLHYGP